MSEQHLDIALTVCFFCGKSDEIVMGNRLISGRDGPIHRKMHGKVVSMRPCGQCADWMKQGIMLIGIIEAKSDGAWNVPPPDPDMRKHWAPNPYRSGGIAVLKEAAFIRWSSTWVKADAAAAFALKHKWMFIEHEAGVKAGIWDPVKV